MLFPVTWRSLTVPVVLVWDCISSSRPTMVFSIPEDVTSLRYWNFIEERIPGYFEDLSRKEIACANELTHGENKGAPWCFFKLADFGFFLLVRNSGIFEGPLLEILEPLNEKLARSCRACRSHELLKRTIQQRALMEKAFRKSEERSHLALEATNDGIWDWEIRTGRVYFSPSYYSMLGYEPYELPQSYHTWEGLLHPDERESVKERIFKPYREQGPWL